MQFLKSTPVFLVDRIEPHLHFWCETLGYAITVQVPHGGGLGFIILQQGGSEVMLQSIASARDDLASVTALVEKKGVAFFHEVDDVDAFGRRIGEARQVGETRITSYGMKEVMAQDEAGYVHIYAQKI
jgi:hypothetical protein